MPFDKNQIHDENVTRIEVGGEPLEPERFVTFGEAAGMLSAAGYGTDFACKMRLRDAVGASELPALHRRSNFFLMLRSDVEAFGERLTASKDRETLSQSEAVELVCKSVGRSARVAAEWLRTHAADAIADNISDRRKILYDAKRLRDVVDAYNESSDREITTSQARDLIVEHLGFAPGGALNLLKRKDKLKAARTRHGLLSFRKVANWINDTAERLDDIADAKVKAYARRTEKLTFAQIVDDVIAECDDGVEVEQVHAAVLSLAKGRKIAIDSAGKMQRSAIRKVLEKLTELGFLS